MNDTDEFSSKISCSSLSPPTNSLESTNPIYQFTLPESLTRENNFKTAKNTLSLFQSHHMGCMLKLDPRDNISNSNFTCGLYKGIVRC